MIPEKFQVKNADGTPNLEASWLKVEEHRAHLERRLGSGDAPPKTADDYKVNVPEALKDAVKGDELAASERFKDFRAEMHAAGLSQKQFDQVVGKMLDYGMKQREAEEQLDFQGCMTDLGKTWANESERQQHLGAAFRAAQVYADAGAREKFKNDPDFIRIMAKVGAELGEDRGAAAGAAGASSEMEVEALQKSKAYWDPNDPQHTATKAKVEAHFKTKFGDGPKASTSIGR